MSSAVERVVNLTYWSGVFAGAAGATVPFILLLYLHGGPVWVGVVALSVVGVSMIGGLVLYRRLTRGRHFVGRQR